MEFFFLRMSVYVCRFSIITFGVRVCRCQAIGVGLCVRGWSLFMQCFRRGRCRRWRDGCRIGGSSRSIRLNLLIGIVAEYWRRIFGGCKRLNRCHAQIVNYFVFYDWRCGHGRRWRRRYVQLLLQLLMLLSQCRRRWSSRTFAFRFGVAWTWRARMTIRNVLAKGVFAARDMRAYTARITAGDKNGWIW